MQSLNNPELFKQQAFLAGEWINGNNTLSVTNPATGVTLGTVPALGAEETRSAIGAAEAAFKTWRKTTAKERSNILKRWFDLMQANADDLARIMTLEQGKPLAEAKGEVAYAASFLEWFAEEGKRAGGSMMPSHKAMPGF